MIITSEELLYASDFEDENGWVWYLGNSLALLDPFCIIRTKQMELISPELQHNAPCEGMGQWWFLHEQMHVVLFDPLSTETDNLVLWPCYDAKAPAGWLCSREEHHEGPCAALPSTKGMATMLQVPVEYTGYRYD